MSDLKIKPSLIGSKVYHPILNIMILIEKGNEERYDKLGMDVFVKRRTPKLQKANEKSTKKRNNKRSSNSNRTNNNK